MAIRTFLVGAFCVVIAMAHTLAVAQSELIDLPSLHEMEAAAEKLAQQDDIAPLVRAMNSSNPFLKLTVLHSINKHGIRLSSLDVAEVMRNNANSIQGSSEATAHEDFQAGLVEYANKLTGLNLHFDPVQDEAVYLRLADEVEAVARNSAPASDAIQKRIEGVQVSSEQIHKVNPAVVPRSIEQGYGWKIVVILLVALGAGWMYLRKRSRPGA